MVNNQTIGELIPIADHNGQRAVNARHLYEWLEVKKQFADWITVQIQRCDLTQNVDYQILSPESEKIGRGRPSTDYALSLEAAKEISMMSQTERGKVARRYFIECERIAKCGSSLPMPMTYREALEQLLEQVKRNEQLQLENETMQPKARIYDQVIHTPQKAYLSTTSEVANEIGLSAQKLNKLLIASGIIYKDQSGDYLITANYLSWNLAEQISTIVNEEKGIVRHYPKWNTRGRAYIHALHDTNWDKRRAWHLLRNGKEVAV